MLFFVSAVEFWGEVQKCMQCFPKEMNVYIFAVFSFILAQILNLNLFLKQTQMLKEELEKVSVLSVLFGFIVWNRKRSEPLFVLIGILKNRQYSIPQCPPRN